MTHRETINRELRHIPKGAYEFQGELRQRYNALRGNDLASHTPLGRAKVLVKCISEIRKRNPDAAPAYDADYFKLVT